MKVLVCPLPSVLGAVRAERPSHLVGLLAPNQEGAPTTEPGVAALSLRFHDLTEPREGFSPPERSHMESLLGFATSWQAGPAPLLVHCWFGISRSPAAAFAILCQANPERSEREIALMLRRRMPSATPNRLMVAIADDILGRDGRMVAAIDGIGRGQGLFAGSYVALSADLL